MAKKNVKSKDGNFGTDSADRPDQPVYISPLTDFGFKKLFYNKELLIPFLNDVVGTDIKDVEYKPTECQGWFSEERTAVFDLFCTTKNDEHFVVEMQLGQQTYFRDRALFYGSHIIHKQAPRKKNWDFNLKPVYIVSILNFNIFTDRASKNRVIERACLYRESTGERFSDKLQMIFIQLPKFKKESSELQDSADTWLFLLKNTNRLKFCPPEITGDPFKLFLDIAELKHLTPEDMKTYEVSLEKSYQMRNIAGFAKMEGIKEGELKGRREGRKEGKMEIAIKLLMRNEPIDEVISITELSRKQVKALLSQLPTN